MLNNKRIMALLPCYIMGASQIFCQNEKTLHEKACKISSRLKVALDDDNLICHEKDGIKVCYLKRGRASPESLPHIRLSKTRINAPLEEISSLWLNHGGRKNWDSEFCEDAQLVKELDKDTVLAYIRGKSRYIYPSRDYAYHICRVPGGRISSNFFRFLICSPLGLVGNKNFMTAVFVGIDAANSVPLTSWSVRGRMNTILLLQPINAGITEATYVVECSPDGWMIPFITDLFADNIVQSLTAMKKHLEAVESAEEALSSIEDAARLRFQRHKALREENQATTIVNDVTAEFEDLSATLAILERRLKDLRQTQRSEGLDLRDLEGRMMRDIALIKDRIKTKNSRK